MGSKGDDLTQQTYLFLYTIKSTTKEVKMKQLELFWEAYRGYHYWNTNDSLRKLILKNRQEVKMKVPYCAKCYTNNNLSRHHIFPKRFKWKNSQKKKIVILCRPCHDVLERYISYYEKGVRQTPEFYFSIARNFIESQQVVRSTRTAFLSDDIYP